MTIRTICRRRRKRKAKTVELNANIDLDWDGEDFSYLMQAVTGATLDPATHLSNDVSDPQASVEMATTSPEELGASMKTQPDDQQEVTKATPATLRKTLRMPGKQAVRSAAEVSVEPWMWQCRSTYVGLLAFRASTNAYCCCG